MKHLRFWTTVLQGLGYAFLLMGTAVGLAIILFNKTFGNDEFLSLQIIGLVTLLLTWTFSALMIVVSSYVEFRTDEQKSQLDQETED